MRRLPPHVLLATTNPGKLREIRALLAHLPIDLTDLATLVDAVEPEETGATFGENARLKALSYGRLADAAGHLGPGTLTVAEDSGLMIDALGGEPGVRSARFLRPDATYPERFAEIERRLASGSGPAVRTARFICAVAAVCDGVVVFETTGAIEGEITADPRGEGGFGYDPIFYYPPYRATLAEVGEEAKLRVAHRGQAFRALAAWLQGEAENGER